MGRVRGRREARKGGTEIDWMSGYIQTWPKFSIPSLGAKRDTFI